TTAALSSSSLMVLRHGEEADLGSFRLVALSDYDNSRNAVSTAVSSEDPDRVRHSTVPPTFLAVEALYQSCFVIEICSMAIVPILGRGGQNGSPIYRGDGLGGRLDGAGLVAVSRRELIFAGGRAANAGFSGHGSKTPHCYYVGARHDNHQTQHLVHRG